MRPFFLILIAFVLTQISMAEENNRSSLYLGAGGSFNFLKAESDSSSGSLGSSMNIGYDYNENLAVEFRKGSSLMSKDSILLDNSMALYFKGKYPINETYTGYMLAGFAKTEVSSDISNVIDDSGFSYGIGVDYKISSSISLYTDFTRISSSVSQINFGIAYYYTKKVDSPSGGFEKAKTFKEKKAERKVKAKEKEKEEKLIEELRIKEKLEAKKKKEAEEQKKKEAEEKLKLPTIVKFNLLHKEDTKKPILVYFFELNSKDKFKRMDYEELINNEKEMLDGEIVTRSKEVLKPGKMSVFQFNVKSDSIYYAVVAAVNDAQEDDNWRYITTQIRPHEVNSINLMLDHKKIMEFSK